MNSIKSIRFSQLIANRASDLRIRLKISDEKTRRLSVVGLTIIFIAFAIISFYLIIRHLKADSVENGFGPIRGLNTNSTKPDIFDKFNEECLTSHNQYRTLHGVPPLILDFELIDVAKRRAKELVLWDVFEHPNYDFKYGENLHLIMPFVKKYSCLKVVKPWYEEIKDYDYSDWRKSRGKIGHFTQVIWKSSRRVGCAQAYSERSRRLYTVCNYSPPGNYVKRYNDNVLPLYHLK